MFINLKGTVSSIILYMTLVCLLDFILIYFILKKIDIWPKD